MVSLVLVTSALLSQLGVVLVRCGPVSHMANDAPVPWLHSGHMEGDVMVNATDDGDALSARNAITNPWLLWPGGVVVYDIENGYFGGAALQAIQGAMSGIERVSCVRFRPARRGDQAWVSISGTPGTGCWSYIGRQARAQELKLDVTRCIQRGTIQHELLHAIGFEHQQKAYDRDNYVDIHWQNIEPGQEYNFDKAQQPITDYGLGYDVSSIMHYPAFSFSQNGLPTITAKGNPTMPLGGTELSEKDIIKLNTLYNCK